MFPLLETKPIDLLVNAEAALVTSGTATLGNGFVWRAGSGLLQRKSGLVLDRANG